MPILILCEEKFTLGENDHDIIDDNSPDIDDDDDFEIDDNDDDD